MTSRLSHGFKNFPQCSVHVPAYLPDIPVFGATNTLLTHHETCHLIDIINRATWRGYKVSPPVENLSYYKTYGSRSTPDVLSDLRSLDALAPQNTVHCIDAKEKLHTATAGGSSWVKQLITVPLHTPLAEISYEEVAVYFVRGRQGLHLGCHLSAELSLLERGEEAVVTEASGATQAVMRFWLPGYEPYYRPIDTTQSKLSRDDGFNFSRTLREMSKIIAQGLESMIKEYREVECRDSLALWAIGTFPNLTLDDFYLQKIIWLPDGDLYVSLATTRFAAEQTRL